jgi:hypothetical protein
MLILGHPFERGPQRIQPLRCSLRKKGGTGFSLCVGTIKNRRPLDERSIPIDDGRDAACSLIIGYCSKSFA